MAAKMKVLDLFAGIGGFSLGLERAGGFETVAFCEIEDYPRKVLARHWPNVPIYRDVRELTAERLREDGISVDVVTGGFPCQDISTAGRQAGIEGERSGLWSELARIIDELRPRYAIMENVAALLSGGGGRWFGRVLGDLAEIGYDAEWHCIPASAVGAPHQRDRVWIIAYPQHSNANRTGLHRKEMHQQGNDESRNKQVNEFRQVGSVLAHPKKLQCNGSKLERKNEPAQTQQLGGCYSKDFMADPNESRLQRWLQNGIAYQAGWEVKGNGCASECSAGWERYRDGYWAFEPDVGGTSNGFPLWLYRHTGRGLTHEESQRSIKTLQGMWCDYVSETLWKEIGGLDRIQQSQVLFYILREYEKGSDKARIFLEGKKASEEFLRELRREAAASCSPRRSKQSKQQSEQYSDTMQVVPQLPSCDSEENWQRNSWEDGVARVADGVPNRAHRLKGLGNAVVPQIPELIGRAILDAETKEAQAKEVQSLSG